MLVINMSKISLSQLTEVIPTNILEWLQSSCKEQFTSTSDSTLDRTATRVMVIYSQIPRKLKSIADLDIPDTFGALNSIDVCRLFLLKEVKQNCHINFYSLLRVLLKFCDDEEKLSIVKALVELDREGVLVDNIIELTRTNSVDLLEAIGLFNTYPAQFYPNHNYNQLVLKMLFSNSDISKMVNLQQKRNSELSRMAEDYQVELINAGRTVPPLIKFIL